MRLKVCGLKDSVNIASLNELQPDYMGFIFWEQSSRYFDGELPELAADILKVGVFVDASLQKIKSKIQQYSLDLVQLHGSETPELCHNLSKENIKIIKAFSIKDNFDFNTLNPYNEVCDYFLFDTKGKLPGGNGITFDWQILQKYEGSKPIFLSGGIGIESINAIKSLQKSGIVIHAIDINSRFETAPGMKNTQLIQQFQSAIR